MNHVGKQAKWDTRFLELACLVSSWSKDPSTKVGVVIADPQNRVVSMGYNGFPRGIRDTSQRLSDRDLKYKMVVHAESNAIIHAGRDLHGCTLYNWPFMPCSTCAGLVIQSGISRVVTKYDSTPRWQESFRITESLFAEAGVELVQRRYE